jgi:hypothetical protein
MAGDTRRPPPGGRAGVAGRSGSGGVEPVPFSREVSKVKSWPGTRQRTVNPAPPSVCRFNIMSPDHSVFRQSGDQFVIIGDRP